MGDPDHDAATDWIEISVEADADSVESVSELFAAYGYNQGVVIQEPYRQDPDGENFEVDPSRPVVVSAYLVQDETVSARLDRLRRALWHLKQRGRVGELAMAERPEEDWASAWREHFQVVRIGRRFVVRPTWREYEPKDDDVVIDLDPGMAFGTGLHPTTELCLRWLETFPVAGSRVLDAGAGSGILSLAAAKLGAVSIDAVEIDPVAVKALRANVALNGFDSTITCHCGDVAAGVPSPDGYDLVLANILSRVLVSAADALAGAVAPGGTLILSGVIERHEPGVVEAFEQRGIAFRDRATGGDWVSLLGIKTR
jgi:ribosomal protein L11 methyltransferase